MLASPRGVTSHKLALAGTVMLGVLFGPLTAHANQNRIRPTRVALGTHTFWGIPSTDLHVKPAHVVARTGASWMVPVATRSEVRPFDIRLTAGRWRWRILPFLILPE
jgi:hypothetical protein